MDTISTGRLIRHGRKRKRDGQVRTQLTASGKEFQNKSRETTWIHDNQPNHKPPVLSHQLHPLTLHSSNHFTSHLHFSLCFSVQCSVCLCFMSENNKLNQTKFTIAACTGLLIDQAAPTWASSYPYIHYLATLLITGRFLWSVHVHRYAHGLFRMYRPICNALNVHEYTYACSQYVTFNPQPLYLTPATCSQSQGSCQVIVQACFTAKPTPNTFRHTPLLRLMYFSWLFLYFMAMIRTLYPCQKPVAPFHVSFKVLEWKHSRSLLMQSAIPLQFRPLKCMEQFKHMHIVNTDVLFCPGDVVGDEMWFPSSRWEVSQPLSCGLRQFK